MPVNTRNVHISLADLVYGRDMNISRVHLSALKFSCHVWPPIRWRFYQRFKRDRFWSSLFFDSKSKYKNYKVQGSKKWFLAPAPSQRVRNGISFNPEPCIFYTLIFNRKTSFFKTCHVWNVDKNATELGVKCGRKILMQKDVRPWTCEMFIFHLRISCTGEIWTFRVYIFRQRFFYCR